MEALIKRHQALISNISMSFQRRAIKTLPWNQRLLGIKGSRGVGKTTLLLQYIKKHYGNSSEALYITLDDIYFYDNRLLDLADTFAAKGGKHLFIDEVHKYENWANEIKNIYDYHPDLKIVFTGSSLLEIISSKADLSRRAIVHKLPGLSFREFLFFRHNIYFEPIEFNELIANHTQVALQISESAKPLQYFDEYLKVGYFPFYEGDKDIYYHRLQEITNMIIEIELPLLRRTGISNISKVKQLLYIISRSTPFKPNISALAQKTKISRNSLLEYFHHLNDANIINAIQEEVYGVSLLQKPDKVYLENTNYAYALNQENPDKGSLRETFFLNQLSAQHKVTCPEKGDFLVDEKYLFEVGGKTKSRKQIAGVENSFVAADDIAFGVENTIPLWMFGFLY